MYEPKFLGWRDEPEIVIEEVDIEHFREKCKRCHREMVDHDWWYQQPVEARKAMRAELCPQSARGLCGSCYTTTRYRHPEDLVDYPTVYQPMDDFVEDYQIYKRRTEDKNQIAKLMGINRKAFDHKFYRAKRMGLI